MSAAAAGSFAVLPPHTLDAILALLPANCIPLALRQLNSKWRHRYAQHTAVLLEHAYVPPWAVARALPDWDTSQVHYLHVALARHGHLECLQLLAERNGPLGYNATERGTCAAALHGHLPVVRWLVVRAPWPALADPCGPLLKAAEGGHVHVLQWLRQRQQQPHWPDGLMAAAARSGHVAVAQWLRASGCIGQWGAAVAAAAAGAGKLEMVQYLRAQGCPWGEGACEAAAEGGHLEALQYLRGHGCPSDLQRMLRSAVWCGAPPEMLQYLRDGGAAFEEGLMEAAVWGGHLHAMQWLHEHGCPWEAGLCEQLAKFGALDMLQYAMRRGCPCDIGEVGARAGSTGRKDALLWLRQQGHGWTPHVLAGAADEGIVSMLEWLREQEPPCPWDSSVVAAAAQNAFGMQALRWLRQQRPPCPWDSAAVHAVEEHLRVNGTCAHDKAQNLQYMLSNGCPWEAADRAAAQQLPVLQGVEWPGKPCG